MQPAFHNALHEIPYQGCVQTVLPYYPDSCTSATRNYHNKDRVQTVLPWSLDGCNSSPRLLALSRIASGRCCPVVRTDAAIFPYTCLWRESGFLSKTDEHPEGLPWHPNGCNLELFKYSRHWWALGRMTGPSGRKLGIRLLWLGICTKSSLSILNHFSEMKTLE
jgi:hypothetical protein